AVGNSVLLTHAKRALLGVRSHRVAVYPDRAHLVGGVLELLRPGATIEDIVGHLRKELAEEFSIEAAELADEPRLLAVLRDDIPGQPELAWQWETRIALEEVAQRVDPQEHAGVELVGPGDPSAELLAKMTPVARATVRLWGLGGSEPRP